MQKKQIQQKLPSSLLHRIEQVILEHALFEPGDRVIVGVSGGSDSLALLHILHVLNLKLQLIAVYVDHGLRPGEVKGEKQTIDQYCRGLHIPFTSVSVNVRKYAAGNKCSLEEAARILRHEALEQTRTDRHSSFIALAHTADDQVEEFLIRLIRGTSLRGLSGMQLKRDRIIRPLLRENKATLIDYLRERGITFCHDSSNTDRKYLRNRVRLDLLPRLENEFNPSIRKTILQNMDILADDENFLEEVSRNAFEKCVSADRAADGNTPAVQLILHPGAVSPLHHSIQCRVLERCFWQMKIKPGYLQIRSLLHFTQTAQNSEELHLADGVRVLKSKDKIVISRPLQQGQLRGSTPEVTFSPLLIPSTGYYPIKELDKILKLSLYTGITGDIRGGKMLVVDGDKIKFPLLLRPPKPGECFRPYNAPGKKKIFRYLSEKKIDAKKRAGYPVLVSGAEVIALPGLQISHEVRVTASTAKSLVIELSNANG